MRSQPLSLSVVLCLAVCGCSGGKGLPAHPKVGAGQIEKDAEAGLPSPVDGGAYEPGEIKVLESNYSGDQATIVLRAGSINVGDLAPADIEGLKPDIRPQLATIDLLPYKLRLEYE
jgi:hypothetical protein